MPQAARRAPARWAALGIAAAMLLSACSNVERAQWTEEVKSWDGHIFQLDGYAEQDKSGYPLAHRGTTRFIEYYHRETGAYWKQPYGYQPAIFDLVAGRPVALVSVSSDGKCFDYGHPPLGLVAFEWTQRGWERIDPESLPIDKMTFNLLRSIFDRKDATKDAQGFISLSEKRQRDPGGIRLADWVDETGRRCLEVKRRPGQGRYDGPPPPVLAGLHGQPARFKN